MNRVSFEIGEEGSKALESRELSGRVDALGECSKPAVIVDGKGVDGLVTLPADDHGIRAEGDGSGEGAEGGDESLAVNFDTDKLLGSEIGVPDPVGEKNAIPPAGGDPRESIDRIEPSVDNRSQAAVIEFLELGKGILKGFLV